MLYLHHSSVRKRIFKTKTFDRWAKKVISDALLRMAASHPGADFSPAQIEAARVLARGLYGASADKLDQMYKDGALVEISHGEQGT